MISDDLPNLSANNLLDADEKPNKRRVNETGKSGSSNRGRSQLVLTTKPELQCSSLDSVLVVHLRI